MVKLDSAGLRAMVTRIEAGNTTTADRESLIDDLLEEKVARVRSTEDASEVRIGGMWASSTEGFGGALREWCRMARALQGEVA